MMPKKTRLIVAFSILTFAISLAVLVIWLMLLRGPALTQ